MVHLVPEIRNSHDPMIHEQMVTTHANPHFSKLDTSFHFPLTNVVDEILDTSRLLGSDGSIPFVLEPVQDMSKSAELVATSMPPLFLVVTPHRSPTMTRNLQLIQQAMAAQSNSDDAHVSNSQKKKNNNHIAPDVHDIVANPDDPIDPNLQRELDLVQHLLIQGASTEVPFTPYILKSKK